MTDRTLRERCLEASRNAMARYDLDCPGDEWSGRGEAEAGFDAVLGVLTEHADEWPCNDEVSNGECTCVLALLAVLGGGVR